MVYKCLSIENPVSYLVAAGVKDVENRTWSTNYRGRIYIHSSGQKDYHRIVINKRTMNIVGGHQRVSAMDSILRKNNYNITAAVIDVDEREEVRINILLNNPSVQGEWDMFKLRDISETFELPPDDMGFSKQDSLVLFDMTETDPMQFEPKEEIAEQKKEEAREHARNTRERQKTDMNKNIGHMDKMAPRQIVLYFDDGKDCVNMLNLLEQEETELELNGNMILSIIREWKYGKA